MNHREKSFFAVVGAPKCGTTSLHHYLGQHPEVFVPEQKELHFFSQPEVAETYYPVKLVGEWNEYVRCFKRAGDDQICGDFSPSYLAHAEAPFRIKEKLPQAKVVICLRNPVDRAISHYLMDQRMGLIDVELLEVLENPGKHPMHYREYIRMGEYAEDLKRYASIFQSQDLRLVMFPSLIKETERVVRKLFTFLGLEPLEHLDLEPRNIYQAPRSQGLIALGKRGIGRLVWKMVRQVTPKSILDKVLYTKRKPEFEAERQWLENYFEKDFNATKQWLKKHKELVIGGIDD